MIVTVVIDVTRRLFKGHFAPYINVLMSRIGFERGPNERIVINAKPVAGVCLNRRILASRRT